ncbi:cytochrome P450 [Pseudomonas sp. LPB0260]|uniref:cytochrome P450 n=1 Tax=Pseudomonas sp. LPB0260 TaxID=2614442 RepID=UPI0015C2A0CB|nr:cytochrome P450 [Pseudomonas sp. LPB0260]QLC72445.1 cytochrome P450 [Pseudomonas sp. LPB0260]QLC75221.1 cytochrome P450 [Pseudomonas sp. LPB0260]
MPFLPPPLDSVVTLNTCSLGLYEYYRDLQRGTPVFRNEDGVVYLARHEDCLRLLSDPAFSRTAPGSDLPFSAGEQAPGVLESMIGRWMVFMDPPDHGRVRKAFAAPFRSAAVKSLESLVRRQVRDLLACWPADGRLEVVDDFAFALPVRVIALVLGVPLADIPRIHAWALGLTTALDSGTPEALGEGEGVARELAEYFRGLIARREQLPDDCLINRVAATAGANLSAEEFLCGCMFLLWAGHETTKNWLASGLLLLAQHPRQLARLQSQPELLDGALEEMLRVESPLQKLSRWSTVDTEFAGYPVPAGTLVTALIGAAHRDPAVFTDPDCFDIARRNNRHMAFGAGIHHCLGVWLARLEARIAFGELLPRIRHLEVLDYRWRDLSAFRSLESLEMKVELKC